MYACTRKKKRYILGEQHCPLLVWFPKSCLHLKTVASLKLWVKRSILNEIFLNQCCNAVSYNVVHLLESTDKQKTNHKIVVVWICILFSQN